MPLTGRFSFRRTLFGKVVLIVEEEKKAPFASNRTWKRWRDASLMDLTNHELRKLLELRDERTDARVEPAMAAESASPDRAGVSPSKPLTWHFERPKQDGIRLNGH